MFTTLQEMVYNVRTAYGDSDETVGGPFYAIPFAHPPQTLGQGNGAGPDIWAVVSTPVNEMLRDAGHGAQFKLALSGDEVKLVGFAFVDDENLYNTAADISTLGFELMDKTQAAVDCFVGGTAASGGGPKPHKCWWWLIEFVWKEGEWSYLDADDSDEPLLVRDRDGQCHAVERLNPSDAKKTLGVWLAPDGNNIEAVEKLTAVADNWASRVRSGHLSTSDAWLSLTTTVMKTLEYPLAALTLTKEECDSIMQPLLREGLPKIGLGRTFPRDVIHAPEAYQGIGLRPLFFTMSTRHVKAVMAHSQRQSLTGRLLRASIEWLKVESGGAGPLFSQPFDFHGQYATDCLVKRVWQYVQMEGLRLEEDTPCIDARREGDQPFMSALRGMKLSQRKVRMLNQVRLYLQVHTVADVVTGDGRFITEAARRGQLDPWRERRSEWPIQGRPSDRAFQVWKAACRFLTVPHRASSWELRTPLGPWLDDSSLSWYLGSDPDALYHRQADGSWRKYARARPRQRTRSNFVFRQFGTRVTASPPDAQPTKVQRVHGGLRCSGVATVRRPDPEPPPTSFLERCLTGPTSRRWATNDVSVLDDGAAAAFRIASGHGRIVCDGSVKDSKGTAAVTTYGEEGVSDVVMCNITPGDPDDIDSTRSELGGIYSGVVATELLVEQHGLTDGTVTVGCDSENTLRAVFWDASEPTLEQAHFDLVSAIRCKLRRSPLQWVGRWIKGHQDDAPGQHLDWWARQNIAMDAMAKEHWAFTHGTRAQPRLERIEDEVWPLFCHGRKVVSTLTKTLDRALNGAKATEYWTVQKAQKGDGEVLPVDWAAYAKATASMGRPTRRWLAKQATGICGVGSMLYRWGLWTSPRCHACLHQETVKHVARCSSRKQIWDKWWTRLEDALTDQDVRPGLADALLRTILALYSDDQPDLRRIAADYHPAVRAQLRLGWRQTLTGKLSPLWTEWQKTFLGTTLTVSPLKVATTTIKTLVAFYQACWAHRRKHLPDDGALAERRGQTEVNRMICEQYADGRAGLPREMAYHFRLPRRFLLSRDIAWKRTWLDSVLAARARATRRIGDDDSPLRLQRALLHNWLARARADSRTAVRQRRQSESASPANPQPQLRPTNITTHSHAASPGRRENGRRRPSTLRRRPRRM